MKDKKIQKITKEEHKKLCKEIGHISDNILAGIYYVMFRE